MMVRIFDRVLFDWLIPAMLAIAVIAAALDPVPGEAAQGTVTITTPGNASSGTGGYTFNITAGSNSCADVSAALLSAYQGYWGGGSLASPACSSDPVIAGTYVWVGMYGFMENGVASNVLATASGGGSGSYSLSDAQTQIGTLQGQVATLQTQVATLQAAGPGGGASFDGATAAEVFAWAFISVMGVWIVSHFAGEILRFIRTI